MCSVIATTLSCIGDPISEQYRGPIVGLSGDRLVFMKPLQVCVWTDESSHLTVQFNFAVSVLGCDDIHNSM